MNIRHLIPLVCLLTMTWGPAHADSQIITLKDGSQLKGELVGISAGVYTVKTPVMGEVHVNTDQVVSIAAEGASSAPSPVPPGLTPGGSFPNIPSAAGMPMAAGGGSIEQQISAAQQQLMANPDIMADIQSFAQDPEITQLLSDPELMQMITSKNVNALQNTPKGQALLNNPKMRALVDKIRGESASQ